MLDRRPRRLVPIIPPIMLLLPYSRQSRTGSHAALTNILLEHLHVNLFEFTYLFQMLSIFDYLLLFYLAQFWPTFVFGSCVWVEIGELIRGWFATLIEIAWKRIKYADTIRIKIWNRGVFSLHRIQNLLTFINFASADLKFCVWCDRGYCITWVIQRHWSCNYALFGC